MLGAHGRIYRLTGLSGVAATILFLAANALWALEQPGLGASGQELLMFYEDRSGRIVAGALLALWSIALFVVFASALRTLLAEWEGERVLGDIAFGGALLSLAAGLGAETINMAAALRAADGELTEPVALAMFDSSYVLGYHAAGIGIGLLLLATDVAALRGGPPLPRALAVLGVALGAALLTPLSQYLLGPAFAFLLVVAVLLVRAPSKPAPGA